MSEEKDGTLPEPWERQPHETAKQYHAFCHYRDLPPSKRSIMEAWLEHKRLCEGKPLTRETVRSRNVISRWAKWSVQNDWQRRVAAWDAELNRRKRLAMIEAAEEAARRQARLAMRLQEIALRRLEQMTPGSIRMADVYKLLELAVDIERKALKMEGEGASTLAQIMQNVSSLEIRMARELTDEELERIVMQGMRRAGDNDEEQNPGA